MINVTKKIYNLHDSHLDVKDKVWIDLITV